MSSGDALARGAKSATFPPAQVSQAKWDAIFGPRETAQENQKQPRTRLDDAISMLKVKVSGPAIRTTKKS